MAVGESGAVNHVSHLRVGGIPRQRQRQDDVPAARASAIEYAGPREDWPARDAAKGQRLRVLATCRRAAIRGRHPCHACGHSVRPRPGTRAPAMGAEKPGPRRLDMAAKLRCAPVGCLPRWP